jgi:chromosome segregation ATPase
MSDRPKGLGNSPVRSAPIEVTAGSPTRINPQLALEAEQRLRWQERSAASAKQSALIEKHEGEKLELHRQLQARESEVAQQREEYENHKSQLKTSLAAVRQREAELLQRCEEIASDARKLHSRAATSEADVEALRTSLEAQSKELREVQSYLKTSDEVRVALLQEAEERNKIIEQLKKGIEDLRHEGKHIQDADRAKVETLHSKCESMARMAQEKSKEADVFEERVRRLEESLRAKTLETDHMRTEAAEERRDYQGKLSAATRSSKTHKTALLCVMLSKLDFVSG